MAESGNSPIRVTLVGAGNVAWHLGHECSKAGIRIVRVLNRSIESGRKLAHELETSGSADFRAAIPGCDFIIVAVKDSALKEVLARIDSSGAILLHTSGSHGLDIFPDNSQKHGVLYPFQTLTKGLHTDFGKIPLCIEASDENTLSAVKNLAGKLSSSIWHLSSQQRKELHLSGILVNNFINHMLARTFDFMSRKGLEKELIKPLLFETLRKLDYLTPSEAQTGPARRNDREIIQKHKDLLTDEPELKKLYSLITDSIIAYYSRNE